MNAFDTRYRYYRPAPLSVGVPLTVIDGSHQFYGGYSSGSMYGQFRTAYDSAATLTPPVDLSLSLEGSRRVRVEVANVSATEVQGTLHIVLVERHRPYNWRDLNFLDFICRTTLPGPNGQLMTIPPSGNAVSVQEFSVQPDWNYCSVVAFFQAADKRILQGAMLDIEDTFPRMTMSGGPETGDLWLKGSAHTMTWSSDRSLSSVVLEYSTDGGSTWSEATEATKTGENTYKWTAPQTNSSRCLLRFRDPFGAAQAISGLFAIGIKGDFNNDNSVDSFDRSVLVDILTENQAVLIPGSDLNEDGVVDLFDLIYFDDNFGQ